MSEFSNILNKTITSAVVVSSVLVSCTSAPLRNNNSNTYSNFQVNKQNNSIKKIDPKQGGANLNQKGNSQANKRPLFDWPVWEARMSRGFLPKRKKKRPHKGIDLAAPRGVPVMASHDGIVIYTGKEFKGFGKMIMIETVGDHAGYATLYGHLDKILVYDGQKVRQGEVVGALGNTGRSSGPHLHFEIRRSDGIPIDPLPMLPAGEALTNNVDDPSAPTEE